MKFSEGFNLDPNNIMKRNSRHVTANKSKPTHYQKNKHKILFTDTVHTHSHVDPGDEHNEICVPKYVNRSKK